MCHAVHYVAYLEISSSHSVSLNVVVKIHKVYFFFFFESSENVEICLCAWANEK